jgi:TRAP-type mannitol/chloroaromatic compound transport system permease large subunit
MTDPQLGVFMLVLFVFLIMLGFPIAFTLMAMGVGFAFFAYGGNLDAVASLLVQRTWSVMTNDILISVPLFVFMGYIVERANILDRLFRSIQLAAGGLPGSLAVATLITCALFATATGIVGAVVTLMGLLAFPAMLRNGYDVKLSAGVICAGGCLGILIPPSIMLILYGATAGVSPVQLYAGALFPGLMLASLYMAYVIIRCIINPSLAPQLPKSERDVPLAAVAYELATSFAPLALLILAVLGAIMFGVATPSEAAAIGALGALVLAIAYGADYSRRWARWLITALSALLAVVIGYLIVCRIWGLLPAPAILTATIAAIALTTLALVPRNSLSLSKLTESVYLTARTSAMVGWLFVGSFTFSAVFAALGGDAVIKDFVVGLDLSPLMFLIVTQIIIFILGWPLEWTEIIVIFVPIFLPLLEHFGIDPLFFGLLIALNIQTSFLSPPVAMAPFYLKGVAPKHVNINDIFSGVMPFIVLVLIAMILLYTFPAIGLWLPAQVYGR